MTAEAIKQVNIPNILDLLPGSATARSIPTTQTYDIGFSADTVSSQTVDFMKPDAVALYISERAREFYVRFQEMSSTKFPGKQKIIDHLYEQFEIFTGRSKKPIILEARSYTPKGSSHETTVIIGHQILNQVA